MWKFGTGVHVLYHASWHRDFQIAVNVLNYGVGAQLGLRSLFMLGTGLTGLGHRSDRLIYVKPMQSHADRSDRSVAPV